MSTLFHLRSGAGRTEYSGVIKQHRNVCILLLAVILLIGMTSCLAACGQRESTKRAESEAQTLPDRPLVYTLWKDEEAYARQVVDVYTR